MAEPERGDPGARAPASSETKTNDPADGPSRLEARIGAYRILELLGAGGMGDVFLAFDARLQRRVAIKRIRSDAQATPRARERLRREAAAAAALSHPSIVHVYDILADESGEAIVMEYVEGETLAARLERGPVPEGEAVAVAREIADGLAAAHAVGLIHRDLKPQNVMLTPAGRVKILDFGLAKRLEPAPGDDALTAEGGLVGTVRSMSPEQARGRAVDARSDLFSLGVLVYELCAGHAPFRGASPAETLAQLVAEPPPPLPPATPPALAGLVEELLQKDPARRPQSAAEVGRRLAAMGADARSAPTESAGHRRTWLAAAAVAVATVVAGAAWLRACAAPGHRVAVLAMPPTLPPVEGDARPRTAAFAVREAVVRALTELEGVETVTGDEVAADALTLAQTARAVAADEVVLPTLECAAASCRVSLRRQRGADQRVVASSRPFDVSSEPEDALALTSAVALGVRELFPDHPPRSGARGLELRADDFRRYLALRERFAAGRLPAPADVDELEHLAQSSPGLFEARLLAASAARTLKLRDRALEVLRQAFGPERQDPRLLNEAFLVELETGTPDAAERALDAFESAVPGDVRAARGRARVLVLRGRPQEALEAYRRLLRERPSWRNLWSLANLEIDLGDAAAAREHLRVLLELSPRNPRGRAKLAELEWTLGDPRAAVRLYEDLLEEQESWENVANLGWSRLLARDYQGATTAYRRALELRPHDLRARLNLGIAREGAGDPDGARLEYSALLDRAAARTHDQPLTATESLLEAQALARLGRTVPAVDRTIDALAQEHGPAAVFQAALIYALCGDASNAIVQARKARRGVSPSWFGLPGFESIRAEPEFQALLVPG